MAILLPMRDAMRKKAGRPKVVGLEKRNVMVRFMATKAEMEKIRAAAKTQHLTLSEYLRAVSIPR
jgi:hypothetical protein